MATKVQLKNKRELVRLYYMQGETQKEIHAKTGVSEQSISKWVREEGWEAKRAGASITRPELVNKSLAALNKILDQVYESNDIELVAALPDKLAKCASAIEKLDRKTNIVNAIEVFTDFYRWLQKKAPLYPELKTEILLLVNKFQDMYINENIKI
jgi:transposase-like protein